MLTPDLPIRARPGSTMTTGIGNLYFLADFFIESQIDFAYSRINKGFFSVVYPMANPPPGLNYFI